jgi:hypothetical protein
MNWTLEVVVVPVSDVDRAEVSYAEQLGFNVDHDTKVEQRAVQVSEIQVMGEGPSPSGQSALHAPEHAPPNRAR